MRSFLAFAIALFVSGMVSQVAALQLAVAFKAQEEFILVMVTLALFVTIAIAVFAVTFVVSRKVRAIDRAALALSAVAVMLTAGFVVTGFVLDGVWVPTPYDLQIMTEFVFPALAAVAIQWWFVRRRRARLGEVE